MTREEAESFGEMWLEVNEDSKDAATYDFFKTALSALKENKGEWKAEFKGGRKLCSNCGIFNFSKYKNFCPNCGADMRGE